MLDQPFLVAVCLANLAFSAIATEEPIVPKCSRVLFFCDPDTLGCLLLEIFKTARSYRHVRAHLKAVYPFRELLSRSALPSLVSGGADRLNVRSREPSFGTQQRIDAGHLAR
jgi:hypothetical protein